MGKNFKKTFLKKKRAFSFIEVIIATFIFVIIITIVVGIFGQGFAAYRNAKAIQRDLEAAQQAVGLMAKVIRTSSVAWWSSWDESPASNYIQVFDYSQDKCYRFEFMGSDIKVAAKGAAADEWETECGEGWSPTGKYHLVDSSMNVSGDFDLIRSTQGGGTGYPNSSDPADPQVGRVTISAKICPPNGCTGNPRDEAKIQTTISLRDYVKSGIY